MNTPCTNQTITDLLTPKESCELLKIKMSKLRAMIFKNEISHVKVGRLIRLRKSDLEKFIQDNLKEKSQGENYSMK